jgi:hypothetical protein
MITFTLQRHVLPAAFGRKLPRSVKQLAKLMTCRCGCDDFSAAAAYRAFPLRLPRYIALLPRRGPISVMVIFIIRKS